MTRCRNATVTVRPDSVVHFRCWNKACAPILGRRVMLTLSDEMFSHGLPATIEPCLH